MKCLLCLFMLAYSTAISAQVMPDTASVLLATKNLKAIVVTSKKPFIEMQIDKTVVNVQADISAIGSSAFEILQKAPGVNITGDDVINMSGKAGVNILIDGRPTQMSSKELANFLRSVQGTTIEKIELITNPSSRFDAQGNAGIINIRLKKNKLKGTNGNVNLGYTQNIHYRSNASVGLNHRAGKINAFANVSIDNNEQHTDGYINRNVTVNGLVKNFNNRTVDEDRNVAHNMRAGVDYYLNSKSTFGFLINGNGNWNPFNTPGTTLISSNNIVDSSLLTSNDNLYKNNRYNTNVNYRYADTLGNEFNVDADYTFFKNTNVTNLGTAFLNKTNTQYNFTANELDVATNINIYALKGDYIKQLKAIKTKIESGIKFSNVATGNALFATNLFGRTMNADTGRSNTFNYNESIYAGYVNVGKQLKKLSFQVGIRVENSIIKGTSTDLKNQRINNPDTSYTNIFPTAFVSYTLNEKNMFAASYSRRINRPDYQSLNPFETIYDIYTSERGNPFLKPQYTNNFEVKYTYRNAFNVALGYNQTNDYSQTITTQTGQQTLATTENIGSLQNTYLNVSAPMPIAKWWEGYANVTGFFNHYKGNLPSGILNEKAFGLNYYIQNNFKLGKGWSTQVSSWYNAATKQAIFKTAALGSLDVDVKKNILKDKGAIRLGITDVFNTQQWKQEVQFANMDFTYRRKWESRGVRLQLSWSFGKTKFQARERDTNQDANRIKVKG